MRNLKTIFTLGIFILFSLNILCQESEFPKVDIKDLTGKTFNTSTIIDGEHPIILSFWATWCKPCVKELNAISDNLIDWQDETGVRVVAVSIDNSRSSMRVAPFINGKGWEFEVLLDPNGEFKRAMNVVNTPHTFVLNPKGKIVYQHTTYNEGDEEVLFTKVKESL